MKHHLSAGVAGLLLCASLATPVWSKKKPKAEAPSPAAAADMQVEGIVGELDDAAVQRVLQSNHGAMRRCYDEQAARLHYVGGHLELKVRVLPSGRAKWVAIVDSNLGNNEIEQCVVSTLEKLQFPTPKGGEGELTCPIDFAARTPTGSWQKERVESVLAKKKAALAGCKGKAGTASVKALRMTLYVGPGGSATSAGFAADEPQDAKLAKCVADRVLSLQFDDPLGQMVKVSVPMGDLFGGGK
jgi:TonB family protein